MENAEQTQATFDKIMETWIGSMVAMPHTIEWQHDAHHDSIYFIAWSTDQDEPNRVLDELKIEELMKRLVAEAADERLTYRGWVWRSSGYFLMEWNPLA